MTPRVDRIIAAAPPLAASLGFLLHLIINQRYPSSLQNAIGPFTQPWLWAIVGACAINGILAVLPDRFNVMQAESATRWVAITLMVGFAVASWAGDGRSIQGILAFTVATWHFSRWWWLRRELRIQAQMERLTTHSSKPEEE